MSGRCGLRGAVLAAGVLFAGLALAEQYRDFGGWRVHYMALNAAFLPPAVAERHGIVRGHDKGLLNVSAIEPSGRSAAIAVSGSVTNLLGQKTQLRFREIRDGSAVYYLAAFDYDNAETLRFELEIELPDHGAETLAFQQPLYHSERR